MFCMLGDNSLLSQNTVSIDRSNMHGICIALSAVFLVIIVFLIINIRKRKMAERMMEETKQKLEDNYKELECAYSIVTKTQKKLFQKYEELKVSEDKNRKLAYHDQLTELPNRNAFSEQLESTLEECDSEETLAVMYIDVDNFKNINDTLGHSYGDELLIDITHRVGQALDEDDYLARFGGDEFIIMSKNVTDIGLYEEKVKKIQTVFSYPFVLATKEFFVTVSIGICLVPKDGKTTQNIIKNVDAAMYNAKELGKNMYCYYNDSINNKLMERIEMQSELRSAIENEEFELYYQAQMNLETNKVSGFEALLRWNHPERGTLGPDKFIRLAEETGLIIPIGRWVLFEACRQLKSWEEQGFDNIKMAVNFSARQFRDSDIVQMVQDALDETKACPTSLEIEITETIALDDFDYSVETIRKLKEMGIEVSIDDFGTGYSSMNYLKLLPVSNLKIDKSFLDSVMDSPNDQKIVGMIIALAQALDLVVIAEGVENKEQAEFLRDANCNKAQGFLYSKPIPKDEAENYLKDLHRVMDHE